MDQVVNPLSTLFEAITRPLPEAAMLISDKGQVVSVNQAALRLLGTTHETICGHAITHQVLDDEDKVAKYLKNCSRAGDLVVGTLTWRRQNGENIPCRSEGAALRHSSIKGNAYVLLRLIPKGKSVGQFLSLNNELELLRKEHHKLEQRKQQLELSVAERTADLAASEAHNRAIVETASEGIITINASGIIESFNPAAEKMFSYKANEIIGENIKLLVPEPDRSKHDKYLMDWNRSQQGKFIGNGLRELYGQQKDGSVFPMELSITQMQQVGHNLVLGIMRDITERKKEQHLLETTSHELEIKANLLERTNQELDQFAYVTSHDLKAPLRAIANLSQWIEEDLEDKLDEENRKQMKLLRGRVNRMEALIEGILEYSRVGRVAIPMELVDVGVLVQEVIDNLACPTSFVVELAPEMPMMQAPRLLLNQVFANLISNGIKYHDREDGKIQVTARELDTGYEFAVSDDGPGIDPQYHEKIFTIFQTLEARDKYESTGVGLTIVKKIIEEQGGTISLESGLGQGSTFRFTWPTNST